MHQWKISPIRNWTRGVLRAVAPLEIYASSEETDAAPETNIICPLIKILQGRTCFSRRKSKRKEKHVGCGANAKLRGCHLDACQRKNLCDPFPFHSDVCVLAWHCGWAHTVLFASAWATPGPIYLLLHVFDPEIVAASHTHTHRDPRSVSIKYLHAAEPEHIRATGEPVQLSS